MLLPRQLACHWPPASFPPDNGNCHQRERSPNSVSDTSPIRRTPEREREGEEGRREGGRGGEGRGGEEGEEEERERDYRISSNS